MVGYERIHDTSEESGPRRTSTDMRAGSSVPRFERNGVLT
jgi:hypothetical protein